MKQKDREAIAKLYVEGLDRSQEYDWSNPYQDDMYNIMKSDKAAMDEVGTVPDEKDPPKISTHPEFFKYLTSSLADKLNHPISAKTVENAIQDLSAHGKLNNDIAYTMEYGRETSEFDEYDSDYSYDEDEIYGDYIDKLYYFLVKEYGYRGE